MRTQRSPRRARRNVPDTRDDSVSTCVKPQASATRGQARAITRVFALEARNAAAMAATTTMPITNSMSEQPHDGFLGHQLALGLQVADGGHQPALRVHRERDLEPGPAVARRVWGVEI